MSKTLPELPYRTIGWFAKARGCNEDDVIHHGAMGHLKICALGNYWTLQEGYFSDDAPEGFPVPTKERGSGLKPIPLTCHALRKILSDGEVTDPEFIFEVNETQDQGEDGEQFDRFLSSIVISNNMRSRQGKVIIKRVDLVIRNEDADTFLSTYAKKDQEILKDALPPQNETEEQHKQERCNQLHDLIGEVIVELGFKGKIAPSHEVWNHIRKHQEKYECIKDVGDQKIEWISYRGNPRDTGRSTFNNIVSEYNTGKKPHPDN